MTDGRERLLFVYGLLLDGEANHGLLEGAKLLGPARTAPKFALIDLGPHPALFRGGDVSVVGELYAVDIVTLAKIDVHEGHPVLFKREEVELDDGRTAEAYFLHLDQVRGRRRIRGGSWRDRLSAAKPTGGARDAPLVSWARRRHGG